MFTAVNFQIHPSQLIIIVRVFITFPLMDSQYIQFHVKVNNHFCSRTVLATTAIASKCGHSN